MNGPSSSKEEISILRRQQPLSCIQERSLDLIGVVPRTNVRPQRTLVFLFTEIRYVIF